MTDAPKPRPSPERKRYEAPRLVEYGDVAKLTQAGGISTTDGTGKKKQGG